MDTRVSRHVFIASALLFAAGLSVAPGASIAQDASGTPSAMEEAHPAHIHSGTCETLGDVVFPLTDVSYGDMMGTPMAGMDATPMAEDSEDSDDSKDSKEGYGEGESATSTTTVQASLDDILAAEHAINVHESAEKIDVYIACGDITGTADGGKLEIDLEELNDSGYEGKATLMDNGDGTTTVDITLMESEEMMGTPEATPSS